MKEGNKNKNISRNYLLVLSYIAVSLILIIIEINSKNKFIKSNLLAIITLTLTFFNDFNQYFVCGGFDHLV